MSIHRPQSHNPPVTQTHATTPKYLTVEQEVENLHIIVSESAYMVEKLAVLGGPSNLHHSWCNDRHLVVPNARIHTECATHTFKWWSVTTGLTEGTKTERKCLGWNVLLIQWKISKDFSHLTSSPVGEILRYSLTSLLLSMALMLVRLTFS